MEYADEGLVLMVLGMGIVFLALAVLYTMMKLIGGIGVEKQPGVQVVAAPEPAAAGDGDDFHRVAVAAAAAFLLKKKKKMPVMERLLSELGAAPSAWGVAGRVENLEGPDAPGGE